MGYRLQLFAQITRDLLEQKTALAWAFRLERRTQDGDVKYIVGEQPGPLCQAQQEPLSLRREQAGRACPSWALWLGAAGAALGLSPQSLGQPCQGDSRHWGQGCPQHGTVGVSFHLVLGCWVRTGLPLTCPPPLTDTGGEGGRGASHEPPQVRHD